MTSDASVKVYFHDSEMPANAMAITPFPNDVTSMPVTAKGKGHLRLVVSYGESMQQSRLAGVRKTEVSEGNDQVTAAITLSKDREFVGVQVFKDDALAWDSIFGFHQPGAQRAR